MTEPTLAPLAREISESARKTVLAGCPGTPYEHCTPSVKLMWALTFLEQREAELLIAEKSNINLVTRTEEAWKQFGELAAQSGTWVLITPNTMPEYDVDVQLWAPDWGKTYIGYWRHSEEWIGRQRPEEDHLPSTNPTHWHPMAKPPVLSEAEKLYAQKEGL